MRRQVTERFLQLVGRGAILLLLAVGLACTASKSSTLTEADRQQVEELLARAQTELDAKNYDRAMTAAIAAYEKDTSNTRAIQLRNRIQSEREAAMGAAAERSVPEQLDFARRLARTNDHEAAKAAFEKVLAVDPNNRDARRGKEAAEKALADAKAKEQEAARRTALANARRLYDSRQYTQAIAAYDEILKQDPRNSEAQRYIARSRTAIADEQKKQQEGEIAQLLASAERQVKSRQFDEAAATYRTVLEKDRGNRDATRGLRDIDSAIAGQKKAEVDKLIQAAQSNVRADKLDAALVQLDAAEKIDAGDSRIARMRSDITRQQARAAEIAARPAPTPAPTPTPRPSP
ncbi:MAG: tetratricopeptide repeat protein, partial [Candidatus Sumerlaeia bacterium]|nr:tetratricopeptide repeat protein [Candidatus Sumerlaeia bacterium]